MTEQTTQTVPKGYKQTEVGLIPSDWDIKKLTELAQVVTGNTPPTKDRSNYGNEYLFVSPADLGKAVFVSNTEKKLSEKGFNLSRKFPKNSILFTCIGSTIGKTGIASKELTSNQQINAVFPSGSLLYLYTYYILTYLSSKIKALAGEQAVPQINKTQFQNTQIPIPSTKTEQIAIATALSDADALIEELEKLITKKRAIKEGAMQELLTCKRRLPGFSGEWKRKKMGEVGKSYGGLSGKTKRDFENGTYPYIPFLNIMNNPIIDTSFFDYVNIKSGERQNKVQKGDLFFNGSSETPEEVGMCSVLMDDIPNLYLNSFCFVFRLNKDLNTNGLYLSYFFRSNAGRQLVFFLAQGATRYNLSKNNFLKLEIPYPRPEEQTAIADIISDMDKEIKSLEQKLAKYRMLKQGMMQVLLTGRIRLV